MSYEFYSTEEYRQKQSDIAKLSWQLGQHTSIYKPKITIVCQNPVCSKDFLVLPHEAKSRQYCSKRCSALIHSPGRIVSDVTKAKISRANLGTHLKIPRLLIPRLQTKCQNSKCTNTMSLPPWESKRRKYCSNACAMKVIGGQTTSPKASKGKPGIRPDIDPNICFYSTWEANVARVFNLIGLKWVYAPRIFDLGEHTYRPDFYLPDYDLFIEVKNFFNSYSQQRDLLFRQKYRNQKLELIFRKEYKEIEAEYKVFVPTWEKSR